MIESMKLRIKYFNYPQLQWALLMINFIVNSFLFTFLSVRVKMFFDSLVDVGMQSGFDENHVYFQFLKSQQDYLKFEFGLAFLISLVVSSALVLWTSHRLAGPLLRLREHLRQIAETGTYSKITFRKNDYFQDLSNNLNQALDRLTKNESQ